MQQIDIQSSSKKYSIYIQDNLLDHVNDFIDINRRYVVISDSGVPEEYIKKVLAPLNHKEVIIFPMGEESKSLSVFETLIDELLKRKIKKDSCLIALGGGVVGDLVGFVASVYLRGVDFIQIPTTLLSQIDSSIGGKVAVNTISAKNIIGSFHSPIKVLIDPTTLLSLPERQFNNGMAEMIKYGMIADAELFNQIKDSDVKSNMEYYIYRSLLIKKDFVEKDEFDNDIRQILNYGHTYGHAIEAYYQFEKYYHGEAIAIGMMRMISNIQIKNQLEFVLNKYHLPISDSVENDLLIEFITKDKKNREGVINMIVVDEIGHAYIKPTQI